MPLDRLVITAMVTEDRPAPEVAAQYGVSRSSLHALLARYLVEGESAFEPRSRRPKTVPTAIPPKTVELIVELRQ
jgi:transposase